MTLFIGHDNILVDFEDAQACITCTIHPNEDTCLGAWIRSRRGGTGLTLYVCRYYRAWDEVADVPADADADATADAIDPLGPSARIEALERELRVLTIEMQLLREQADRAANQKMIFGSGGAPGGAK